MDSSSHSSIHPPILIVQGIPISQPRACLCPCLHPCSRTLQIRILFHSFHASRPKLRSFVSTCSAIFDIPASLSTFMGSPRMTSGGTRSCHKSPRTGDSRAAIRMSLSSTFNVDVASCFSSFDSCFGWASPSPSSTILWPDHHVLKRFRRYLLFCQRASTLQPLCLNFWDNDSVCRLHLEVPGRLRSRETGNVDGFPIPLSYVTELDTEFFYLLLQRSQCANHLPCRRQCPRPGSRLLPLFFSRVPSDLRQPSLRIARI